MTDILQISDNHGQDLPVEILIDQYEQEDVDAIVYTGDATQKAGADAEESLGLFERSIGQAGTLGQELNADVYFVPGNHDPVKGSFPGDEDFLEDVEQAYAEENEDYEPGEDDFYEEILEENGVEDLRLDTAEVGDTTIVGGTHHHGPKEDWVPEYEVDDLYEEDELEEVAGALEEKRSGGPDWYEWVKSSPWEGINSVVETIGSLLGYEEDVEVDPDELSLQEVPEELRNERHQQYEEMRETAEEEWQENSERKKQAIIEGIEEADGEAVVFDHGLPYSDELEEHPDDVNSDGEEPLLKGSEELKAVFQEKSDEIKLFGGGHFHGTTGRHEMYGVDTVNSAQAITHYSIEEDGYEVSQHSLQPAPEDGTAEAGEIPQEVIQQIADQEGVDEEEAERIAQQFIEQQRAAAHEEESAEA